MDAPYMEPEYWDPSYDLEPIVYNAIYCKSNFVKLMVYNLQYILYNDPNIGHPAFVEALISLFST